MPIPKIVTTAVLMAANMALTAMNTTEGPRLTDTRATVADYGTPSNYVIGTRIVPAHCIFTKPIEEKRQKRKGKGGKQVTYTGYCSFACQVTAHAYDDILQIWMDNHLVYDATGSGEEIYPLADDYDLASSLRFMPGAEDQEPDPDMLAYIEARDGAGTCPAYRDQGLIYFDRLPLESFGNRRPDVKVMVRWNGGGVGSGTSQLSVPTPLEPDWEYTGVNLSQDGTKATSWSAAKLVSWDVAAAPETAAAEVAISPNPLSAMAVGNDGTVYYSSDATASNRRTFSRSGLGTGAATVVGAADDVLAQYHLRDLAETPDSAGRVLVYRFGGELSYAAYGFRDLDTGTISYADAATAFGGNWDDDWGIACDRWGDCWTAIVPAAAPSPVSTLKLWRIVDNGGRPDLPDTIDVTGLPPRALSEIGGQVTGSIAHIDGYFLIEWALGEIAIIDETTGESVASNDFAAALGLDPEATVFLGSLEKQITAGDASVWVYAATPDSFDPLQMIELALPGLTLVRTVSTATFTRPALYADAGASDWPRMIGYLPASGRFIAGGANYEAADRTTSAEFLGLSGGGEVTLGTLLTLVADRAGLLAEEVDFSAATSPIPGYNWTQGTGPQICEHLCDLFDTDLRPHDFTWQALPRGSASAGSLPIGEFVAGGAGEDSEHYSLVPAADEDLPRRVFLTYADTTSGQEPNTAMPVGGPDRGASGSQGEYTIDAGNLALDPATAQQLVERRQRRIRFARTTAEFALTRRRIPIEPGDVWTPDFDGDAQTMRCTKMTLGADGVIATEWEVDDPRLAQLPASQGAPAAGYVPPVIPGGGPSLGEVMDVPLLIDAHDQTAPLAYLAAGPEAPGTWTGADFAASDTGELDSYVEGWDGIASGDGAIIGTTVGALPAALPWVPDNGSSVTVDVNAGELTSATLEQLLADPTRNLAAIAAEVEGQPGWELLQFMTATLVAERQYALSGFLRGVRGTEWAIGGHAPGNRFVLLDGTVKRRTLGAAEIGDTDYYIVSSTGQAIDEAEAVALAYTGATHKPLAPVHGEAELVGADWQFTATRRTRIGGGSLDNQDVPLGQASESWSLDILDGSTVVRTIAGTALPLVWTEAQQIADLGAAQGTVTAALYQVDPTLNLRGYPLAITG